MSGAEEKLRAEFEGWADSVRLTTKRPDGSEGYPWHHTQAAWMAWKACRSGLQSSLDQVTAEAERSIEQLCGDVKACQMDYNNERRRAGKAELALDQVTAQLEKCRSRVVESAIALDQVTRERDEMVRVLKRSCDRDWNDEIPVEVAIIAANGLHWRNVRAEAESSVDTLRGQTVNQDELFTLRLKVIDAEKMAKVCDDWVQRGVIDSRSALADARLEFGKPYEYPVTNALRGEAAQPDTSVHGAAEERAAHQIEMLNKWRGGAVQEPQEEK